MTRQGSWIRRFQSYSAGSAILTISGRLAVSGIILLLGACGGNSSSSDVSLPVLSVTDASVREGNDGVASLTFTISLNKPANGNVNVVYASIDGSAHAGSDYTAVSGALTIYSGTTSNSVTVSINGDTTPESDETLTLALSGISPNAKLDISSATGVITNDDPFGRLNDTGITTCGDYAYGVGSDLHQNNLDCDAVGATATEVGVDMNADPVPAGQDAHFGRDVTHNDDTDGHAGFSFTKIDSSGYALPVEADNWECVLDNVTGLMWEVKTNDGGLRDKDWTYSWFNSTYPFDMTEVWNSIGGWPNGGVCVDSINCDTEKYVTAVNNDRLCGADDWRMPTHEELQSIADIDRINPAIDTEFFPNTAADYYWTANTADTSSAVAHTVLFDTASSAVWVKDQLNLVRLVRGGQ